MVMATEADIMRVEGLTMAHGERVIQQGLDFAVRRGEILAIMGGSGCGKSTLLRHMIGLQTPAAGCIRLEGEDLNDADERVRRRLRRRLGVMFQAGALWSSMSVGENLMFALRESLRDDDGRLRQRQRIDDEALALQARFRLALVGLDGSFERLPAELSGGMRKRAAIARALCADAPLLFLDEPSAGLDPLASARLDALILQLRDRLGTTVVLVTHELDSLFAVADRALFLDARQRTMTALDNPHQLREHGPDEVRAFLRRDRSDSR
ncbi:ABC transporter ATP-binding protein [Sphaerotilus natans]|uniref:ABC transporter ATP-binding protein n=1 Tax=Sphaerotilus natans TaxID=34103 RepID=UPI00406D162B